LHRNERIRPFFDCFCFRQSFFVKKTDIDCAYVGLNSQKTEKACYNADGSTPFSKTAEQSAQIDPVGSCRYMRGLQELNFALNRKFALTKECTLAGEDGPVKGISGAYQPDNARYRRTRLRS
jgi:hypothetical protein